jgi:transposase
MRGIARPNSERLAAIKLYATTTLSVEQIAARMKIPSRTIATWVRPIARSRYRYRGGDEQEYQRNMAIARQKAYQGYAVIDACTLTDTTPNSYYKYLEKHPFKTKMEVLLEQLEETKSFTTVEEYQTWIKKLPALIKSRNP